MNEPTSGTMIAARIHAITYGADGVLLFDLRAAGTHRLPAFEPGAHVDVRMPGGIHRSYSLLNDARERHRYVLGIKREATSRGGSAWMHDSARTGSIIEISAPRNHFELAEDAAHTILVAGGIGITPLWSMVQRLQWLGRRWTLYYRARSRTTAPLLHELALPSISAHVKLSFSEQVSSERLDLQRVVAEAPAGAHFYCCGPAPMMQAFEKACATIDPARVHVEYFASTELPATQGGFVVHLARAGRDVPVAPGQTILESLRACGIAVPSSCQQGVCGECEVKVLAGAPDHRDLVLSAAERASGRTMMICCSGALSQELTLDI